MKRMLQVLEEGLPAPPATHAVASTVALADPDVFRQIVETHSARLFRLAYRMTGNTQDAEDLVQETYLRAYRAAATFKADASVTTWLHRICANAALDHLRRRSARPHAVTLDDPEAPIAAEALVGPAPDPERLALSRETRQQVEAAMATLTPMERAAFGLRHGEQLSIEEIGAQLGLRTSATKNTIFRGVQKLRRALKTP